MQLKLKVLWLKNFLGFAIDRTVTKKSYPLTSYYFWPKTEAWDQLKLELDSKFWVSEEEKIKILNLITDIINYWRQNRANGDPKTHFSDVKFLKLQELGL